MEQPIIFGNSSINTEADFVQIQDKININNSSKEELMLLKGIGDKKADAIVEYRKQNGNFINIEQLKHVKGISNKLYNDIKDFIFID